jgi:Icc-related predicted phosphoesterase
MRLFFATDLHGSDVCFRKLCAAADFYDCEALIMGGDVSGKFLIPILAGGDEVTYELGGLRRSVPHDELDRELTRIANMGYYPVVGDEDLVRALEDPEVYEQRLLDEAIKRVERWVEHAEERLGRTGVPILFAPGNDDEEAIDAAFAGGTVFVNCQQQVVRLNGTEIVTEGWSNPTPWKTPRECPEEELEGRLRDLVAKVEDVDGALFNFHVPPHGTTLDVCPKLDENLTVVTEMGNPVQVHAGSTAVRTVIEEYQPLGSLHGHIHESRSAAKLGRTTAINPGSEYGEGVLMGAIVTIQRGKLKFQFTTG